MTDNENSANLDDSAVDSKIDLKGDSPKSTPKVSLSEFLARENR